MFRALILCMLLALFSNISASTEVCTNSLLPGAKGDQGETGEEGDQGKHGKNGPPGLPGIPGEPGLKGEMGHTGKMGPTGDQGDKGHKGVDGPAGLKGKTGTTCDCGRYRKVIEQLNVNIGKLRNAVKFVKNGGSSVDNFYPHLVVTVVLGLKETEEMYYLLVKESKRFRDAVMNCKLRGGTLAMPKTINTNRLMADYVSQAGLTRVYVGVQTQKENTDGMRSYIYADSSPLRGFSAWSQEEKPTANSTCVELLSTGTWGHVECEATMFFICEFPKSRRRGSGRGTSAAASK